MSKQKISGSDALILSLLEEGVTTIFGYPGGQIIPVFDRLYDYKDKLHHVLVRHEQGATHAAQGYARVSGKVGVALFTSGPAATNAITGLADAMMDSTPIVVITGQVPSSMLGTDAFQETDVMGITLPITKGLPDSPSRRDSRSRCPGLLHCPYGPSRSGGARPDQGCPGGIDRVCV